MFRYDLLGRFATTGMEWTPLANLDGPIRKLSFFDLSVRITPI